MRKIVILNSKGGCGKTTLATNLASYFAGQGLATALLDHDPQGSSMRWLSLRPESKAPIYGIAAYERQRSDVTRSWQMRVPPDTRRMIIDAPAGVAGIQLYEYVRSADTILIPVLPSPIDIHAVSRFVQDLLLTGKARAFDVRLAVVANRVKPNTLVFQSLERFLHSLKYPFIARLRDTQNYVRASEQGVGIHDLEGSRVAKDRDQWRPLVDWIESVEEPQPKVRPLAPVRRVTSTG